MAESTYVEGAPAARVVARERSSLGSALSYLVLALVAVLTVFPFLWMLSASLMAENESAVYPPRFLPTSPSFDNYLSLFGPVTRAILPFDAYIFNSVYIAVLVV